MGIKNKLTKLLDLYYLVWLRDYDDLTGVDWISYRISGTMALTISFNVLTLFILFCKKLFYNYLIETWISWGVLDIVLYIVFLTRYNKKRRARLRKLYEDEDKSIAWVAVYAILTFGLFAFSLWFSVYDPTPKWPYR